MLGGVGILVAITVTVDADTLRRLAAELTFQNVATGIVLAVAIHLILAVRLRHSSPDLARLSLSSVLAISLRQGLILLALPARSGELAYPVLLARLAAIPARDAVMNLLLIRSGDFLVIAAFFAGAFLLVSIDITTTTTGWVLMAVATLIAGGLYFAMRPLIRAATRLALRARGGRRNAFVRLLYRLHLSAAAVRPGRKRLVLALTVARWLASVYLFWTLMHMAGANLPPAAALFCVMSMLLFSLIPVQTIGGIGLGDGAFVAAMVAAGVPLTDAAFVAVAVRICWLILLIVTALCLLRLTSRGRAAGERV